MTTRNQIDLCLWQGEEPERRATPELVGDGFGLLVLCYMQHQEPWERFDGRGFSVLRAPMDDDGETLRSEDIVIANDAAATVYRVILNGAGVLVTCHRGLNRSGLVSALALRLLYGWSGKAAMEYVRYMRPGSLFNPSFAAYLESLQ